MNSTVTRRTFLKYSIGGAGLTIAVGLTPLGWRLAKANEEKPSGLKPFAYIEISPDNTVTVLVGQTELGQGTHTGIPMIVAEELEADWKLVFRRSRRRWAMRYSLPLVLASVACP